MKCNVKCCFGPDGTYLQSTGKIHKGAYSFRNVCIYAAKYLLFYPFRSLYVISFSFRAFVIISSDIRFVKVTIHFVSWFCT